MCGELSIPLDLDGREPQNLLDPSVNSDYKDMPVGPASIGPESPKRERLNSMDLCYIPNEDYPEKRVPYTVDQATNQGQAQMNDAQPTDSIRPPMIFQANYMIARTQQLTPPLPKEESKAPQQIPPPSPSVHRPKPKANKQTSQQVPKKKRGKCKNAAGKLAKEEKGKMGTLIRIFKELLEKLDLNKGDLAFSIPLKVLPKMRLIVEGHKYKTKQVQAYNALIGYKEYRSYMVDLLDYAIKLIKGAKRSHIPHDNEEKYVQCFTEKRSQLEKLMDEDGKCEVK